MRTLIAEDDSFSRHSPFEDGEGVVPKIPP